MAEIHKLLQEHGKAGVLALDVDRRVVEAAAGYLGSEESEVGFLYSGWAQSALPHKKLANDMSWQVHTDHVSLVVQPGHDGVPGDLRQDRRRRDARHRRVALPHRG